METTYREWLQNNEEAKELIINEHYNLIPKSALEYIDKLQERSDKLENDNKDLLKTVSILRGYLTELQEEIKVLKNK
jgi:hypothetical protein